MKHYVLKCGSSQDRNVIENATEIVTHHDPGLQPEV
jgi:hypothetical protein